MLRGWTLLVVALLPLGCVRQPKPGPKLVAPPPPPPRPSPEPEKQLPEMIQVLGGLYTRGRDDGPADERPKKTQDLTAYWIDTMEADVWAYGECVRAGSCTVPARGELCTFGAKGKEQHPINCITYAQAEAYCRFRQKRLPTEAEWEKAARSATDRPYVWGDQWPPPPGAGNFADVSAKSAHPFWTTLEGYNDGAVETAPVDSRSDHTAQGVLNMAGNVAEWVSDGYEPGPYKKGKARVVRGASFGQDREPELRVTHRAPYDPGHASAHFGVRCVREAAP